MRFRKTVFIVALFSLIGSAIPANASQTDDAQALSHGTFIGTVNIDCEDVQGIRCSVRVRSTLCVEVVAGTQIGGSCSVSISGTADGIGTTQVCLAIDPSAGGSVSSVTGPYMHNGLLTLDGSGGTYDGSGDAGATGVVVEAEWASAGCTNLVNGVVKGSFTVIPSP